MDEFPTGSATGWVHIGHSPGDRGTFGEGYMSNLFQNECLTVIKA